MSITRRLFLSPLVALTLALVFASAARADTITFNSLEQPGINVTYISSYTEAGFTFTSNLRSGDPFALFSAQQSLSTVYAGSAGLSLNYNGDSARLSHGGTSFSLNSIDLSRAFSSLTGSATVTFVGHYVGGTTTTQTFTFSQYGFRTFTFDSSFTNLDYVDFGSQVEPYFQFDNVVVNAHGAEVPEPATMLLLGTGLAGLTGAVRKRRAAGSGRQPKLVTSVIYNRDGVPDRDAAD